VNCDSVSRRAELSNDGLEFRITIDEGEDNKTSRRSTTCDEGEQRKKKKKKTRATRQKKSSRKDASSVDAQQDT
jgi:hypothetical protein